MKTGTQLQGDVLDIQHDILDQLPCEPGIDWAGLGITFEEGIVDESDHVHGLNRRERIERITEEARRERSGAEDRRASQTTAG